MVIQKSKTAEFVYYRPEAKCVRLISSFNGCNVMACSMKKQVDGCWTAPFELPPGTYHFRYFVDGKWFTDDTAFGIINGDLGIGSFTDFPMDYQQETI